jgi:membrane-associated phospholipid phosphatase
VTLTVFAICCLIVVYGAIRIPGGYDGSSGLNVTFGLMGVVWALGFAARCASPGSKMAAAVEGIALFVALSLVGSLATAALVLGSGPYIDPALAAVDRVIMPFVDWRDMALALPEYPRLQGLLGQFYVALNWQAFLFFGVALAIGRQGDMEALLTALSVGLLICILPFHWLPAVGPYPYFDLGSADVPGSPVALPWESVGKIQGLRSGAIDTISADVVSGLVAIPSFHACSAVIFGWAFWRYRLLRWPMLMINVLMLIAAVPIGGHYFIDIIVGGAAGAIAILPARALERRRAEDDLPEKRAVSSQPAFA